MAISLKKGERVSLTKDNPGLSKIMIGLGWDPATKEEGGKKKGFLASLFGGDDDSGRPRKDFDLDASVFVLKNDKLVDKGDIVYYGHLKHSSGAIIHQGDNLTGEGEGDDENILVDLSNIPLSYNKLVFVVNIYSATARGQHFGMVNNSYIRIVDQSNNTEILRYNLQDKYDGKIAMIFGEIYKKDGEWKFNAVGEGTDDGSISKLADRYR